MRKRKGKIFLFLFQEELSAFFNSHYWADFSVVKRSPSQGFRFHREFRCLSGACFEGWLHYEVG